MAPITNKMTFNQISTVVNAIYKQATGQNAPAVVDTSSFVSVATTLLQTSNDTLINAISQVLTRTIFSARPYNGKLLGMIQEETQFGNHIRKLTALERDFEDSQEFNWKDGQTVDMYKIKVEDVLQTNWYGQQTLQDHLTFYRDQIKVAFSSPSELMSFMSMRLTTLNNKFTLKDETMRRMVLNNFIAGIIKENNPNRVVKLVTEYNTLKGGGALTKADVLKPENFPDFFKFVIARIKEICTNMTEYCSIYHTNVSGKSINRHTPYNAQHIYLFNKYKYLSETSVLSEVYNDKYLKLADFETINCWQNMQEPDRLKVTPSYMNANGTIEKGTEVDTKNVLGTIFDSEAIGINRYNAWSSSTPFNAAGGYSNTFWHWTNRYFNDFTENGVVLLLE